VQFSEFTLFLRGQAEGYLPTALVLFGFQSLVIVLDAVLSAWIIHRRSALDYEAFAPPFAVIFGR
jgi:hypothetical protein